MCFLVSMVATAVPLRNLDTAAAEASGLVWGNLARQVRPPGIPAAQLERALVPLYGVTWNRDVLTPNADGGAGNINVLTSNADGGAGNINVLTSNADGGAGNIDRFFCLVRNPPLIRSEYDRLVAFLEEAYLTASLLPHGLSGWRSSAHRRRMEMHCGWERMLAVCAPLSPIGVHLPPNIAAMELSEFHTIPHRCDEPPPPPPPLFPGLIWSISRSVSPDANAAAEHLVSAHAMFTQDALVKDIRRHSAQHATSGKLPIRTHRKLHVPRSFSKLGAARRIRLSKSPDVLPCASGRYIQDATQENLPKQAKGSLPGPASAFRRYTAL